MTELDFYHWLCWAMIAIAAIVFVYLFVRSAPYGRHQQGSEGPTVKARTGWMVMESPAAILVALYFVIAPPPVLGWAFLALWELHYVNRAFVFPFRMRGGDRPMPVMVVAAAFVFNLANSYMIGRGYTLAPPPWAWHWVILGGALFLLGMAINRHADQVLFSLRSDGDTGYKIPHGGLYRYISCPNYFGEIIEWIGFAVAVRSFGALVFAIWTVANLAPRAWAHHRWYRGKFADYPAERRALIPFVW